MAKSQMQCPTVSSCSNPRSLQPARLTRSTIPSRSISWHATGASSNMPLNCSSLSRSLSSIRSSEESSEELGASSRELRSLDSEALFIPVFKANGLPYVSFDTQVHEL